MVNLSDLNLNTISDSELGELLVSAKKAYYTGGKPIMDDATYDTLEEILRQKNPHHRFFKLIGSPNFDTGFPKKTHTMPMGSQNKVTSFSELKKYFELKKISQETDFVVQPKCDGLSLEIEYRQGRVVDAITRGDGFVGDLITQNVVKMQNFVPQLNQPFTGSIRCEIVVTYNDFQNLNNQVKKETPALSREGVGEGFYSNPRNAASGISQRLDGKFSEFCTLMAVDIASPELNTTTEADQVKFINQLGIKTVDTFLCQNLEEVEKIYRQFESQDRDKYDFELDGLVIKINNQQIQQQLGSKNNRPKGQVAYKFPSRTDQTRLINVVWQTGPYGNVTPVAQIEPVEISGAVITFASLSNYDLIKEMGLNIGDIVEISRRGDVIPHVEKVISKVTLGVLPAPDKCPVCQSKLISDNKFLRCPNSLNCSAQLLGTLRLFCATLDIKGISDKTISKLSEAGLVKLPGDFYKLTPADFANLDGLGQKSGTNIVSQIQAKKNLTLVEIFDAAAIPNFSAARIRQVVDAGFDTPQKILNLTVSDLEVIPGFQTTLATKIITGIASRLDSINSILAHVSIHNSYIIHHNSKLSGLSIAITGDLSRPRKQIEEDIINAGGKVVSSVTKNTDYLVCNQTNSSSSKFTTAQKLDIKIIDEDNLDALLNHSDTQ